GLPVISNTYGPAWRRWRGRATRRRGLKSGAAASFQEGDPHGSSQLSMLDERVLGFYSAPVRNSAEDRTSHAGDGDGREVFRDRYQDGGAPGQDRELPAEDPEGLPGAPGRVVDLPRQRLGGGGPLILGAEGGHRPADHQRRHADPDVRGGPQPEDRGRLRA